MAKKIRIGKMLIEIPFVAVISAIMMLIISAITRGIASTSESWSAFLLAITSAALLLIAIKIHPKDENFVETIPTVILSFALLGLVGTWFSGLPTLEWFDTTFSWTALAFVLSSVYFADVILQKIEKALF